MTNYQLSAYGPTNPNAGRPANGDRAAWGGYAMPNCPPASLLATTAGASLNGQTLKVSMRKELVPLWELLFRIAVANNYQVWGVNNGENWGPWGMDCRYVSGTTTPSGHSIGVSVDINAPNNPYSYTFQSDMPPAMVQAFEACGMYWGGRYVGQKYDAMHFGYCFGPESVAGHISKAQQLLGASGGSTGDDDVTDDDVKRIADEVMKRLQKDEVVSYNKTDAGSGKETVVKGSVTAAIGTAATYAGRAAYRATKIDNQG